MATTIQTQAELYEIFKNTAQSIAPELTDFSEGAINDAIAGAVSTAATEVESLIIDKFNKTFVETSHGPEVTGGPDDLQTLLVDHFGNGFARPAATPALGVVTFSRINNLAGNILIPAGTVVKTEKNANGEEQRFSTLANVTIVGLSINASVQAITAGSAGNVGINTVVKIETALLDPLITVSNTGPFSGGQEQLDDANYREFARNKIETIRGATAAAIQAAADNVPGVEKVTVVENPLPVKEWDITNDLPVGNYFYIPFVKVYIADANGGANQALIDAVYAAVFAVKAAGVVVQVLGAAGVLLSWDADVTFNPSGPNYPELASDPTRLLTTMKDYIADLGIGADFIRPTAEAAIMAIWGPSGTNDLISFTTITPVGNVATSPTQKLIPDVMTIN